MMDQDEAWRARQPGRPGFFFISRRPMVWRLVELHARRSHHGWSTANRRGCDGRIAAQHAMGIELPSGVIEAIATRAEGLRWSAARRHLPDRGPRNESA